MSKESPIKLSQRGQDACEEAPIEPQSDYMPNSASFINLNF